MVDLIAFHNYSRHSFLSPSTMIPRPRSHRRSLSSGQRTPSPDRTITKAKSVNDLAQTLAANSPAGRSASVGNFPESGFSTLKDPRLPSSPETSETSSPQSHHPDLNDEVAALSLKLVQAINNQTNLDDTLVATRQELDQARSRIQRLESENEKYQQDIDRKVLINKADADAEISSLKVALAEEKTQRAHVEKGKKTIEQELETLTAALFEEANKMVAAAKLEREAVEKKNDQLRAQVKDTELLLASHQEQLAELKAVMQHMNLTYRGELDIATAPSSPAVSQQPPGIAKKRDTLDASDIAVQLPEELVPGPATSFPHLIKPVCRTDVHAYEDFRELFSVSSCNSKPPSRAPSGTYSGLNVMSLAGLGGGAFSSGFGSNSPSPAKSQTHSPNGSMSSPQPPTSHAPLKETRFYKRIVLEDIEPTLRLDAAPGISWLTRRTVLSGICEGSLVVEPVPAGIKKYEFPCSLCGERRTGSVNERTHRFRTSDNEMAQRYPLCLLCLAKVRSCCEFTGYLRLILDGHLRAADTDAEKDAWEETIRLRERMFWSRVGAGVIPLFNQANSPEGEEPNTTDHQVDPLQGEVDLDQQPSPKSNGLQNIQQDDDDDESIYEESFMSAGSGSPVSSAAKSTHFDHIEPHNLDSTEDEMPQESIEHTATSVTITAADNGEPDLAPNEVSKESVERVTDSVVTPTTHNEEPEVKEKVEETSASQPPRHDGDDNPTAEAENKTHQP